MTVDYAPISPTTELTDTAAPSAIPTRIPRRRARAEREPVYYYDSHLTEEDLMSHGELHIFLIRYLMQLIQQLYRVERWYIAQELAIYQSRQYKERPVAPDVAVFKGVVLSSEERARLKSWKLVMPNRHPPQVVFEVASDETWKTDIREKPEQYAKMGVREYYFYDPRLRPAQKKRLRGWKNTDGQSVALEPDEQGRLWSEELESFLVPDGEYLRLFDVNGVRRLTGEETERAARLKEEKARLEEQKARLEERRARQDAEAAREKAWAKLRALGIDPETLE